MDRVERYVHVMIGISGSGKSRYAEVTAKPNEIIISSDAIRDEMGITQHDKEHNKLVFAVVHKRAIEALKKGHDIWLDATNVGFKSRAAIFNNFKQLKDMKIHYIAHVMTTPWAVCVQQDEMRDRHVGMDVIKKQLCQFCIPLLSEGFETIEYVHRNEDVQPFLPEYPTLEEVKKALHVNGDVFKIRSHWHVLDNLFDHLRASHYNASKRGCSVDIVTAALFHDIGFMYTQSIDKETGEAHYYNHPNVGAYVLMSLGVSKYVCKLVNYHMYPFGEQPKYLDDNIWTDLLKLHEIDEMSQ